MAVYDAYGRQKAEGIVRLAVNTRLIYVTQPAPQRVIV